MPDGLLAYLVNQFIPRREPVATHALSYLASEYPEVRQVLGAMAAISSADRDQLVYRPEAIDAGTARRPGIVGEYDGRRLVVVEATFWAELTQAQPCAHLGATAPGAVVLFLCPSQRIEGLCKELAERVHDEGLGHDCFADDGTGLHVMATSEQRHLAVTSWPVLLQRIREAAPAEGSPLHSEVDQLEGMVHRLERELVVWSRSELHRGVARATLRKATATADLVFDCLSRVAAETATEVKVSKAPGWVEDGGWYYHSAFAAGGVAVSVGFAPEQWGPEAPSPLAFRISGAALDPVLRSAVYQVYVEFVSKIWSKAGEPFDQTTAWPESEGARWWWGPIPVAADRSADETRRLIVDVVESLFDALRSVGAPAPRPTGAMSELGPQLR